MILKNTSEHFFTYLKQIQNFNASNGVIQQISNGFKKFDYLDDGIRRGILSNLQQAINFVAELEREKINQDNAIDVLAKFLECYQLDLPPGIFDKVSSEDYLEVYTPSGQPIMRSSKFDTLTSYPLDEVYLYPYSELFERDAFSTQAISRAGDKIFHGEKYFIPTPVLTHQVWEKRGPIRVEIRYKFMSGCYFKREVVSIEKLDASKVPAPFAIVVTNVKRIVS